MSTNDITLHTYKNIFPMIYAYSTPGVSYHEGWSKIGYTEAQSVEDRIRQQTHTAGLKVEVLTLGNALFQTGNYELFTDRDFHNYLEQYKGIEREKNSEWFHIDKETAKQYFNEFRDKKWQQNSQIKIDYTLRDEQNRAVEMTKAYFENGGTEFLWNAKPRFGKCLSAYDLIRHMNMKNVLIVTNRPSVSNSWLEDFVKFMQWRDEYRFVTENDALKKSVHKRFVMSRKQFYNEITDCKGRKHPGMIEFESLQDLKGSVYHGGTYDKLEWIHQLKYDLLIVDESHEGVDTHKTDIAFDHIHRKYTLYLSGTPFKAIANADFAADQVYNWSYGDEQAAKAQYELSGESNPYERLPRLSMFTYQLSSMIRDKLEKGCMISDDETVDYAFDLNEFFKTNESGKFIHLKEIEKFLDTLTTNEKYPFSTPELRKELCHTLWILDRVNSAKALAKLLEKHPVFENYKIVVAAGDGIVNEDETPERAYDKVKSAIKNHPKTITLSVGQLTVGVTIPEWSGVLMLCNMTSPAAYMQAAFRAQNPCTYNCIADKQLLNFRKENAYIFDFDPARTLIIFDEFANNLALSTSEGRGTASDREENVRRLLNFFPILGEDDEGKMIELDAAKVLTIPRRIKSMEVVRRGFMSNFLFQNIANIFGAPSAVTDIVKKLSPAFDDTNSKPRSGDSKQLDHIEDVPVDEHGDINIPTEIVIGTAKNILGEKKWEQLESDAIDAVNDIDIETPKADDLSENTARIIENSQHKIKQLKENIATNIKENVVPQIAQNYGAKPNQKKKLDAQIDDAIDTKIDMRREQYEQKLRIAQAELERARNEAETNGNDVLLTNGIANYQTNVEIATRELTEGLQNDVVEITQSLPKELVETSERLKAEAEKKSIEDEVRAHLRGFSRSIPSFLMAYGNDDLKLSNFDQYTEPDVFKEVTGITLEDFKFLRDGGDYTDESTGKTEHFKGQLFDEIVFNDSVREFMNKRRTLANYFDESLDEDIFDYIPPQKTNQIFTPKWVVQKMVDELEKEDPGCFDNPNHTFADLYMKSGLYITEIVKRLFHSDGLKSAYPDETERIRHIIRHQVYGMAPTRIIYLIATNYILGFDETLKKETTHFVQADAAEAAKSGTLQKLVDAHFG
ncbi:MAG: DEAD/DEAH box helicase family protein [Proteobacteria bacterium]|nr:DEAD/DEAH box helicase family protein [Pseudomonadota bacterium]